jgi:serine phosphatase RsbU (regulator of sigma subunit)
MAQRGAGAPQGPEPLIAQQYFQAFVVFSALIIIFHPAFHFILELLPGLPPDSLGLRLVSAGLSAALLAATLLVPPLRAYSPWLQVVSAGVALIITHQLVINSANHPMYLAASLTAVYGAQLSFLRLREWLATAALILLWLGVVTVLGPAEEQAYVALLFYVANYTIATALVWVRVRLQQQEMRGRLALQQANGELRAMSDRLQNELELAREIQQSLLPPPSPAWSEPEIVCYSRPARAVGGDFYSYHRLADDRVALAVGDVSGKGASAALLMATSLSLFNTHVATRMPPASLLSELDRSLLPYTQPHRQNCGLCYVELGAGELLTVNAGGVPPYVRHRDGRVEWPDARGFALGHGMSDLLGYTPCSVALGPGDLVVLVSDGVVEAQNTTGELFGFERLEAAVASGPSGGARAMLEHVTTVIERFAGATEPHDDMTIVVAQAPGQFA